MTISSEVRKTGPYTGNGSATVFPFAFKVFDKSDIRVVRTTLAGIESDLLLDSDYSVVLNTDQDNTPGGTVNYPISGTPLPTGYRLTIVGDVDYTQPADITNSGAFYPQVIENALDRATIQIQQVKEQADRALTIAVSDTVDTSLPPAEANTVLGWNADGTALTNFDPTNALTTVVYGTSKADTFTGDGSQTAFVLSENPGALNNLDVSIGGVVQTPSVDYTLAGATLNTAAAVPNGVTLLAKYKVALAQGTMDAASVTFTPSGSISSVNVQSAIEELAAEVGGATSATVTNIAALRAVVPATSGELVGVLGYYTAGDAGGGEYYYAAADITSTDNGGSVIVGAGGARWKLVWSNMLSVKQFGAKGDGATDDTATMQAAITAAEAAGGGTVWVPKSTSFYKTTVPLLIRGDINLEVLGDGNPIIKCFGIGATSNGFTIGDPSTLRAAYITLRNIKVWGSAKTNGHGLRIQQCNNVRIVNCSIYNHGQTGIYGSDTYTMRIHDSEVVENGTSGIYLTNAGANGTVITRTKIIGHSSAGSAGVLVDGLHYGAIINGCDFEFNHHGIKANQCHGITISDNYFETNTNGSIYVQSGASVRGLVATGNVVLDSYFDINSVTGGFIAGNTFEKAGNVLLLSGNTDLQIGSNNFPGGGAATGGAGDKWEYQAFPAWVEYTVQWYSSSSPQPAIGNGTLRGFYKRMGKTVVLRLQFLAGSTTTFGTGTWSFTLPYAANGAVTNARYLGPCRYNHSGTINYTNITAEIVWANTNNVYLVNAAGGSLCGITSPFVWVSGDEFHLEIVYEAA